MKKFILAVCLILFPFALLANGVLIEAKGLVTIRDKEAKTGTELKIGDVVKVGGGGKATIMLESGAIKTLKAGESYTCEAHAKKTGNSMTKGLVMAMNDAGKNKSGATVHGMVKGVRPATTQATTRVPKTKALTPVQKTQMDKEFANIATLKLTDPSSIALMHAQVYYRHSQFTDVTKTLSPYCKEQKCYGVMRKMWRSSGGQ